MFLRFLSAPQRQTLLLMAYRMVAADGVVRKEESSLLDALRHELSIPAPRREHYVAGPDLTTLGDRRAQMAAMLKLSAIAYSDREFHPEEVRTMVRFGKSLNLSSEDMKAVDSWGRRHEALVREATELIGELDDPSQVLADALSGSTDDGAADGLAGKPVPSLRLPIATGGDKDLSQARDTRLVVACYSVTAGFSQKLPPEWRTIPDAQDSSEELVGLRNKHEAIRKAGAELYALSAQTSDFQKELALRLGLKFPLLSDSQFAFTKALGLPTIDVGPMTMLRRLTLVISHGIVEHVFYPVFPPDSHAEQVLDWLTANPAA
ncbi:Redoxin (modular protein) [Magnetospirillum sp. LM-5]|uniref:redoxin family protein n=1 Tax=Magnetospirillum sp. LM-5 TaxID=2681466 RepID=UPI00137FFF5E|nr:redoxin family protein [Magnetospirillum sp. LM-5]CAA7621322.1 Redoxin (modular protein) [Magnetospirillum sp. LM-5]